MKNERVWRLGWRTRELGDQGWRSREFGDHVRRAREVGDQARRTGENGDFAGKARVRQWSGTGEAESLEKGPWVWPEPPATQRPPL